MYGNKITKCINEYKYMDNYPTYFQKLQFGIKKILFVLSDQTVSYDTSLYINIFIMWYR